MNIKVFQTNERGKVEFTINELERLLNEIYDKGYADANARPNLSPWGGFRNALDAVTTTSPAHVDTALYSHRHDSKTSNDSFSKLAKELNF